MRFSVFFLLFLVCTGLGSGLDFFSFVLSDFVSSVLTCFNFVATLSLGFVGLFFSEIILDICESIFSLPGFRVAMQWNDAITCVLASPSLLPFQGNQVQGSYRLPVPKPNHFAFLMFFCFKLIFGGWHPPRKL